MKRLALVIVIGITSNFFASAAAIPKSKGTKRIIHTPLHDKSKGHIKEPARAVTAKNGNGMCGVHIGDRAPAFKAKSTKGIINFPSDYRGKWVILFSHPADFTPVCKTEFKSDSWFSSGI